MTKYRVVSKLKKYSEINNYTFKAYDNICAKGHIIYKLKPKFSELEILKSLRNGRLKIIVEGEI